MLTGSSNLPGGTTYSGTNGPPQLLGKAFAVTFTTDGSQALHGFQAVWSRESRASRSWHAARIVFNMDVFFAFWLSLSHDCRCKNLRSFVLTPTW